MVKPTLKELTEKEYEERLDEIYGEVKICGYSYSAGRALKEIDSIAFGCGLNDEEDEWLCGECNASFETEDEAENCCKEA